VPKVALRPKLGFKSMATTTPSGPNTAKYRWQEAREGRGYYRGGVWIGF